MSEQRPSAQEFLVERDIVRSSTERRAGVLACIACMWNTSEQEDGQARAYGYEIMQCQDIKSGSLYPMLGKLEDGGVLEKQIVVEADSAWGTPIRHYIVPADSELGDEFKETLEPPDTCPLGKNVDPEYPLTEAE